MIKFTYSLLLFSTLLFACKEADDTIEIIDPPTFTKYSYKSLNTSVDSLQYNNPLQLDLNEDGIVDYYLSSVLLEHNDLPYLYLFINRKTPNLNKTLVRPGEELPINALWGVPLEKDFSVQENLSSDLIWSGEQTKTALLSVMDNGSSRIFDGEWLGKKDKYLGLKFIIDGKYHYGWLRISHNSSEAKLAIADFAFNKTAGQPIKAGEK